MPKRATNRTVETTWRCSNPPPGWLVRIATLRSNTGGEKVRQGAIVAAFATIVLSAAAVVMGSISRADPPYEPSPDSDLIRPLPVIAPTPSNWAPKFPFPYDQTRGSVTEADITAEREMCQWYNAQYETLRRQIDRLQFNRITPNGPGVINFSGSDVDYSVGDIQQQVDIVTSNIDQSVDFLAPRVQALTQAHDYVGDVYFPLYEGESFYLLWQHLSNVSAGIKAHQPDWFTGPSVQRVKRWGTRISRSHVCD
ncbi:hypothetical protein MFM001_46040 [Mycobacterium sp. MFM001]|nr:hypothetical protein MFM001_46040 [Mycobacterium sp. MFM001]